MRERETWRLLALLGGLNLLAGLILIAVGAAYDFLGRVPGTMAIAGVTSMSLPWLALARHMQHSLAAHREEERKALQVEAIRRGAESSRLTHALATGAHRTLRSLIDEHGEDVVRLALERGSGEQ